MNGRSRYSRSEGCPHAQVCSSLAVFTRTKTCKSIQSCQWAQELRPVLVAMIRSTRCHHAKELFSSSVLSRSPKAPANKVQHVQVTRPPKFSRPSRSESGSSAKWAMPPNVTAQILAAMPHGCDLTLSGRTSHRNFVAPLESLRVQTCQMQQQFHVLTCSWRPHLQQHTHRLHMSIHCCKVAKQHAQSPVT